MSKFNLGDPVIYGPYPNTKLFVVQVDLPGPLYTVCSDLSGSMAGTLPARGTVWVRSVTESSLKLWTEPVDTNIQVGDWVKFSDSFIQEHQDWLKMHNVDPALDMQVMGTDPDFNLGHGLTLRGLDKPLAIHVKNTLGSEWASGVEFSNVVLVRSGSQAAEMAMAEPKCNCEMRSLMMYGCKCGRLDWERRQ